MGLIYKARGHQVGGMNSEIAYEDLGSFTSEVIVSEIRRKPRIKMNMIFTDRVTGIRGVGRNRTCAFHACMAEVARHRYSQWKTSPKPSPVVDMGVLRAA